LQSGDAVCSAVRYSGGFPRFARRVLSTHSPRRCVHPIADRSLEAGLARRRGEWVLMGSSNSDLHGHCLSPAGRNTPQVLTRPACGFSSPPASTFRIRIFRPGATPKPSERVNHAPDCEPNGPRFPGSRAHQLRPTVFRLPGIILEFFAAGLAARARETHVLSKNWCEDARRQGGRQ
jgi:hypothetical protein